MTPRLGLLGSGEFMPWAAEVDRFLLDQATAGDGSVAICPTASAPEGDEVFERWASMGMAHYESIGVESFVVPMKVRDDAFDASIVSSIERASLVFFSGGNPAYVSAVLQDSPFFEELTSLLDRGATAAGCSAGACMFGEVAPDPTRMTSVEDAFSQPGLAVLKGYAFGAHWDALDTFYPGLQAIALAQVPTGTTMVGLDEDTAMASDGEKWRVFGTGGVHVYLNGAPVSYQAGQTFTLA